ncbi:MAG: DNA repair protein RecO [Alphaproteobacteria bacterium]|jgi:DNA repair protein RecO (recombination protein O)|nr:DNA repair protein RecO [Alphaproteobacteria bacterium]
MDWQDDGIVLSLRKHGESSVVVHLLTREHGRHSGLVRGGNSKKQRGVLQPGNEVHANWRARLEEHLGNFSVELLDGHTGRVLSDASRLAAMSSACALLDICLPEREPYPNLFASLKALLLVLPDEGWEGAYVAWELSLLAELGFGLDLSACAATGVTENLIYVSPKSGRAVSAEAGEVYRDKLLPLPRFLLGNAASDSNSLGEGLRLTGYFLERHVLSPHGHLLPDARSRIAPRPLHNL